MGIVKLRPREPAYRRGIRDPDKRSRWRGDNLNAFSSLTGDTVPPPPNGRNGPSTGDLGVLPKVLRVVESETSSVARSKSAARGPTIASGAPSGSSRLTRRGTLNSAELLGGRFEAQLCR